MVGQRRSLRLSGYGPLNYNEDLWEDHAHLCHSSLPASESPPVIPSNSCRLPALSSPTPVPESEPLPAPESGRVRPKAKEHVPRPPNPFIVFRSHYVKAEKAKPDPERHETALSRAAGATWKAMSDEEKKPFEDLAIQVKAQHAIDFPNYTYSPKSRGRTTKPKRPNKVKQSILRAKKADLMLAHCSRRRESASLKKRAAAAPSLSPVVDIKTEELVNLPLSADQPSASFPSNMLGLCVMSDGDTSALDEMPALSSSPDVKMEIPDVFLSDGAMQHHNLHPVCPLQTFDNCFDHPMTRSASPASTDTLVHTPPPALFSNPWVDSNKMDVDDRDYLEILNLYTDGGDLEFKHDVTF